MNWNDAIYYPFGNKNRVEIAGDKLQCFVDAVKKIDVRAEYNSMGQRKPIPGVRFFHCDNCDGRWSERSRDCHSPSVDTCTCGMDCQPVDLEEHPEWAVDKMGNLE